jgi:hypothetical protein
MMGYTTNYAKTRINVANNCWGLLTASCAAIAVGRFPRRAMFMTSAATMFLMFLGFTVAMEKLAEASNETPSRVNKPAAHAALFFYFAFSPCYNIGNNAITYSTTLVPTFISKALLIESSLPHRTFPLRTESPWYRHRAGLGQDQRFFHTKCQLHCHLSHWMEIHGHHHSVARL